MAWLKSDEGMPENDKIWELTDAEYRLYDAMRHYCARKLTDGHVPLSRIPQLTPKAAKKEHIERLLGGRLIHKTAQTATCRSCMHWREFRGVTDPLPSGGYMVHDYLEYNPSRLQWLGRQETRRAAGEKGAAKRWGDDAPNGSSHSSDHRSSDSSSHRSSHSSTYRSAPTSEHGPYPVPRTPYPGAIAPVPRTRTPEPEIPDAEPAGTARSGSQARREGLRQVGTAAARIVGTARGAR